MQCEDCPNQTDGTCCHQLIRPQGSKTMNALDEEAFVRELTHKQMMQSQKKDDGLTNLMPHIRMPKLRPYVPEATNHSEAFNQE